MTNPNNNIIHNSPKWEMYKYKLNNKLLSTNEIIKSLNEFWKEKINNIEEDQIFLIQFKVIDFNSEYKSISPLINVSKKKDLELLCSLFLEFLNIRRCRTSYYWSRVYLL
uniref:DNA polymerase n=1 Tax=Pleurotus citrinopileatus TaxID=98342 RepID=A0A2K9YPG7_PLECI|nr:DNA polymerase [Pleurotus citrinopileatus]AUW35274.1 DNA polymerase [Pleurotus citrinopileatus]